MLFMKAKNIHIMFSLTGIALPVPLNITNVTSACAIWNTTAGGNSLQATAGVNAGNYYGTEPPIYAIDGNITTKYTKFRKRETPFI